MPITHIILPPEILKVSERLLAAIQASESRPAAEICAARADGFVLALETARTLDAARIEALYIIFDDALEARVRQPSTPHSLAIIN